MLLLEAAPTGGHDVVMRVSRDGGDSFGERVAVSRDPGAAYLHGESPPVLLVGPEEDFNAFWVAHKGNVTSLQLARSLDYGHSFSEPVRVETGAAAGPFFTAALAPGGTLLVAWLSYGPAAGNRQGNASLDFSSSTDSGRTWAEPVRIAVNVCPCCRPDLVATSSAWFAAWRSVSPEGTRDIVVAASHDHGQTWPAVAPVSADGWKIDGCPHAGPVLAVAGRWLWVAWSTAAGGEFESYLTSSAIDQLKFGPRLSVAGEIRDVRHPRLAAVGGRVLTAVQARAAEESKGFAASRVYLWDATSGSVPSLALPHGPGSAVYPRLIGLGPKQVLMAWTDMSGDGSSVWTARARLP